METISTPIQKFNPQEPIPGYLLRERIGEGGFGEVWRAEAPGGLSKAVKIVYGAAKSSKAERELKALNRIKQVQHPLLLSLERIEVVDGHLVIVTELADGSLSDRFQERCEQGHVGIERDELLGYLSDAADALDFLFSRHSLQHLDVKPENLLLLANHVKVADFGMVKELHEQHDTLVGGMTPLYAPPELYDGKPNQHSDQYSLAVVYQHLLTGQPPFAGRTAAQLAAQHLHATPDLSPLAAKDRPAVGRALGKDPKRRFASCQEFICALRESRTPKRSARGRRRTGSAPRLPAPDARTPAVGGGQLTAATTALPWPTAVVTLAPLAEVSDTVELVPTLFVGVGQLAATVLRTLRQRITSQLGPRESTPSFQFLLIDSDVQALATATQGDRESVFKTNETVAVPLRDAQHYRGKANSLLEWLERRWLYNIPRSLQTEGLRPLGRLAFVDHFASIRTALQHAIGVAADSEFREKSANTVGRPFRANAIRVVVVGSTSGGTSSGMLLDLAYGIRSTLRDLNLSDDELHGVILHGSGNQGGSRDLQLGAALAFLREFAYYNTAGTHYPGEPTCGIPTFESNAAPFAYSYLVDLGERLGSRELESQAERVADYLFAANASGAAGIISQARETQPFAKYQPGECRVRTFSLAQVSADEPADRAASDYLCGLLLRRWIGDDSRDRLTEQEIQALAEKFTTGLDLKQASLSELAERLPQAGVVMDDPAGFLQAVVGAALQIAADSPVEMRQKAALESIDDLMAGLGEGRELVAGRKSWQEQLADRLEGDVQPRVAAFLDWFAMLAKQPKVRLRGVQLAITFVTEYLSSLEGEMCDRAQQRFQELSSGSNAKAKDYLLNYATLRFQQYADRSIAGYVGTIRRQIQEHETQLHEFLRQLDQLAAEFGKPDDDLRKIAANIESRRRQLLVLLENQLKEMSLSMDALADMANATSQKWAELAGLFRKTAAQVVAAANAKQRVSQFISNVQTNSPGPADEIGQLLSHAKPRLHQCGGSERAIVLVPDSPGFDQALASLKSHPELRDATVVRGAGESVSVCYEMRDIPLANAIVRIASGRSQCFELADRLQSRVDVDWDDVASGDWSAASPQD